MVRRIQKLIFVALLSALKEWDLNLENFVGFGSDGASTMLGKNRGVFARLKKEFKPFLLAVHCVVHCVAQRTNLAALQVASTKPCDVMSNKVDELMNALVVHFEKSSKRSHACRSDKMNCLILRRYQNVSLKSDG